MRKQSFFGTCRASIALWYGDHRAVSVSALGSFAVLSFTVVLAVLMHSAQIRTAHAELRRQSDGVREATEDPAPTPAALGLGSLEADEESELTPAADADPTAESAREALRALPTRAARVAPARTAVRSTATRPAAGRAAATRQPVEIRTRRVPRSDSVPVRASRAPVPVPVPEVPEPEISEPMLVPQEGENLPDENPAAQGEPQGNPAGEGMSADPPPSEEPPPGGSEEPSPESLPAEG